MKHTSLVFSIAIMLFIVFGAATPAWALQSHGEPEGLFVHQISHLLFAATLAYLYWHTRKSPAVISRGWRYLQIFCILFFSWNLLAFIGHQVFELLDTTDFVNRNTWNEQIAGPVEFDKLLYFITKMDHLLIIPAFMALAISLRTFYLEARERCSQ